MEAQRAVAAKSLQSCLTLCNPTDGSLPGFTIPGIQARTLEWVAISFSNSWKWKWSHSVSVRLFMTPRTTAYQAPPSMGFSRQEYWSGVPFSFISLHSFGSYLCPSEKFCNILHKTLVVQLLSHVQLFVISWSAAHLASLSFTCSQNLLKFMSKESVILSKGLILCCPYSP